MRKKEATENYRKDTNWDSLAQGEQDDDYVDPDSFTEEELRADPEKRFHVNPDDFPIFSQQYELPEQYGNLNHIVFPVDKTMGMFVSKTADTVSYLSGESANGPKRKTDLAVYLDKSARPVSWLVNTFWSDFTDKKRPESKFLAIDRINWLKYLGVDVSPNGYVKAPDGSEHVGIFSDIPTQKITKEDIARIRALFIPGGITTEDPDEIMATKTSLEGKNITVIDEVFRSGTTLQLAKYLLEQAIPEANIDGFTFWVPSFQISRNPNEEKQMRSQPIWYDRNTAYGRGIGDINQNYYNMLHERLNTPRTRAQKFGAFVLGEIINLKEEPRQLSIQLAKEIQKMHSEFKAGHILMAPPRHYDEDKWMDRLKSQGVLLEPANSFPKYDPNRKKTFQYIADKISQRKAA